MSWSLIIYLVEWSLRLVMLLVVTRRRHPGYAMAWLLVIFFQPIPGTILYALFGNDRLPRRRIKLHSRLSKEFDALRNRFAAHPNMVRPDLGPEFDEAVTMAERLSQLGILGGNHVTLLCNSCEVIDRLVANIDAAKHHVHLLFYIYANDATGRRVADALMRAVQRGVVCRVLVDAAGSRQMLKRLGPSMIAAGIYLEAALPVNPFRRRMARIDLRNHRKIAVIDGQIGYTGSQNIVDASYGHKDLAWKDLMVQMTGPAVLQLQSVFLEDWFYETDTILDADDVFPDPKITGDVPVQTLPSGPNYPTENYQRLIVTAVHRAQRRVVITTPYFVPDEPFLQAMETAVLRGVEVVLIVPKRFDQILVAAASRAYYEELLDSGVQVYQFTGGLLHAKTMTVDGTVAFFGTSNFDIRSFALNFEVNLVLYGGQVVEDLCHQQDQYITASEPLLLEAWEKRPSLNVIGQNLAKLLSPLL